MKQFLIIIAIVVVGCKQKPTDASPLLPNVTNMDNFENIIEQARHHFAEQAFGEAIAHFEKAAALNTLSHHDQMFLSLACLQNNDQDNAIRHYKTLLENGYVYQNEKEFDNAPNFYLLHTQPEWEELKKIAYANIKKDRTTAKNKKLRAKLDELATAREALRHEFEDLYNDSLDIKQALDKQDSLNARFVMENTDKLGWLGKTLVGLGGTKQAAFMLLQAEVKDTEKYLPLLRAASVLGELDSTDLVVFEDKILVANGKKQTYATQFHSNGMFLYPTDDFQNVNKRRMAQGLLPYTMKYAPPMAALPDSTTTEQK